MTSSGNNYSRKFHGTMTLPGIYELHKLNIWQEKKKSILGKLSLADIKCQQYCS